jgi:hypothetical protein
MHFIIDHIQWRRITVNSNVLAHCQIYTYFLFFLTTKGNRNISKDSRFCREEHEVSLLSRQLECVCITFWFELDTIHFTLLQKSSFVIWAKFGATIMLGIRNVFTYFLCCTNCFVFQSTTNLLVKN